MSVLGSLGRTMKFLIRRKSLKNSAIIAVAFVPLLCATAISALSVTNTISVGSSPYEITSDGTHVWVTNSGNNTVSEIDASTHSVISTISVGRFPCGITSDGTHVWVANKDDNTVSEIDAKTGIVIGTISVAEYPFAISSDGTHVWVTHLFDHSVSEIDAKTGTVLASIQVGSTPHGITSDGTHVWVTNSGNNTVSEIDASTGLIVGSPISVGSLPCGITSDGTHVWVANIQSNSVSEISFNSSVTYANGGGTGSVPTQSSLAASSTFIVAASSLSYPGYAFSGWTDGVNTYRPGDTYTIGSTNVTLTAVWNVYVSPIVYSKPTAPSSVTASLSNGTATVSFTPGSSGNLATYDEIDMYINGQLVGNVCNVTGATSCPIANLGPDATFTFTVTAVNSKGSATSAVSNAVSYASQTTVSPTTTTTTTTVPPAKRTITCVKGKVTKKVTAVSPVCPAGYKKK